MRAIDVKHKGREKVICCWEVDGVLIDPGPGISEPTLLEALDGERPRALLLTHIHFDHAGATGALVRRWPDLPVYVHERGAPHMVDPSRLVASAGRLYGGEDGLRALWGEMVPVPEANLRVLTGGERDVEGAFRVEYTPGHASHHVCYFHEPERLGLRRRHGGRAHPAAPVHRRADAAAGHRRRRLGALDRDDPRVEARRPRPDALRPGRGRRPPSSTPAWRPFTLRSSSRRRTTRPASSRRWRRALSDGARPGRRHDAPATPLDQLHMGLARWRKKFGG